MNDANQSALFPNCQEKQNKPKWSQNNLFHLPNTWNKLAKIPWLLLSILLSFKTEDIDIVLKFYEVYYSA